jgi:hypothetical protein
VIVDPGRRPVGGSGSPADPASGRTVLVANDAFVSPVSREVIATGGGQPSSSERPRWYWPTTRDFRNGYRVRAAARVDRVHQIIRASCHPVGDPRRTGAGLPDAVAAVGLAPNPRSTPVPQAHHPLWSAWTPTGLTAIPAAPPVEPPGATGLQAFTTGAPLAPLRTMRSAGLAVAETDDQTD